MTTLFNKFLEVGLSYTEAGRISQGLVPTNEFRWRALPTEEGRAHQRSVLERRWDHPQHLGKVGEWRPIEQVPAGTGTVLWDGVLL